MKRGQKKAIAASDSGVATPEQALHWTGEKGARTKITVQAVPREAKLPDVLVPATFKIAADPILVELYQAHKEKCHATLHIADGQKLRTLLILAKALSSERNPVTANAIGGIAERAKTLVERHLAQALPPAPTLLHLDEADTRAAAGRKVALEDVPAGCCYSVYRSQRRFHLESAKEKRKIYGDKAAAARKDVLDVYAAICALAKGHYEQALSHHQQSTEAPGKLGPAN